MKTSSTKSASVAHVVLAHAAGAIEAVPTEVAPSPPETFVASKLGRGNRPQRSQIDLALKVATEVRESPHYVQQFGAAAPNPVSVADALTLARGWSDKLQNAAAWYEYVKQQEHAAWKQAFTVSAPLRVPLEISLARDASVADSFPSLAAFFASGKERAQKGVATRKKNKAAKAAAATSSTPVTATQAAPVISDPLKTAAVRLLN